VALHATASPARSGARLTTAVSNGQCISRLLLSRVPVQQREQLLNEAALHLAQAEGDVA